MLNWIMGLNKYGSDSVLFPDHTHKGKCPQILRVGFWKGEIISPALTEVTQLSMSAETKRLVAAYLYGQG